MNLLNTTIYVPKFIFKFSNSDVKYMLTHELIHYKRKDLYFNLLTISALLIHWFNPLVWILVNKIKNCREYACDAGVLEFLGEEENVDYKTDLNRNEELSTEIGIMSIYDRDDLKKAEGFLGFNPKMPLNLNNNVVVDGSGVGLTGDSDVENNKINYELNLFYNHGDKRITFNQSNHDSFNFYKRIKENGYVDRSNDDWATNKKINMDKLDVDGKIVYKYMESFKDPEEDQSEASTHVYYKWEENGVYCSLVFVDTSTLR